MHAFNQQNQLLQFGKTEGTNLFLIKHLLLEFLSQLTVLVDLIILWK